MLGGTVDRRSVAETAVRALLVIVPMPLRN